MAQGNIGKTYNCPTTSPIKFTDARLNRKVIANLPLLHTPAAERAMDAALGLAPANGKSDADPRELLDVDPDDSGEYDPLDDDFFHSMDNSDRRLYDSGD